MLISKGFAGGFGGCLGVGCAISVVVIGLPIGYIMLRTGDQSVVPTVAPHTVIERVESPPVFASPVAKATQAKPETKSPEPEPPPKKTRPTNLVVANAGKVYDLYEENEVRADGLMKNLVFAVGGKVRTIATGFSGNPYVSLSIERKYSIFCVQCMFAKDEDTEEALAELRPDQHVVIAGKCIGKMGNVVMRDCWLYGSSAKKKEEDRENPKSPRGKTSRKIH